MSQRWSRLKSYFGLGRSVPPQPTQSALFLPASFMPAGLHLDLDEALSLSVVWACVDAITKAVASCSWNVFTTDGDRRVRLNNDGVAYLLNVRPNPDMTAIAWKEAMLFNALTDGNAYAEIVRDKAGRVAELWPLETDRVTVRRTLEPPYRLFFEYSQPGGGLEVFDPRDIYHLHGPGITGLLGDNVVTRAAKSMGLAAAMERYASTYFGNNTIIGGVLEYPRTLDDRSYKKIQQSWEERFRGPSKSNKPVILEGGMKWTPIANNPDDAQLIAARKFQIEEICRWYGVPPHKVQHLERSTFNNIEHLGIEFVRDALKPWALRLEQEADYKLFSLRGPPRFTSLDMAWLAFGDAKSRAETYQIYRRMGVYSANDILRKEGENGIGDEGDVRIVEKNMVRLEDVGEAEEAALETAGPTRALPTADRAQRQVQADDVATIRASLARHLPSKTVVNMMRNEREALQGDWLTKECEGGLRIVASVVGERRDWRSAFQAAVQAVDEGTTPRTAAEQFIDSLTQEARA